MEWWLSNICTVATWSDRWLFSVHYILDAAAAAAGGGGGGDDVLCWELLSLSWSLMSLSYATTKTVTVHNKELFQKRIIIRELILSGCCIIIRELVLSECCLQVNQTPDDWRMEAKITGKSFSGPDVLTAVAGKVTDYPLKFLPLSEGTVEVITNFHFFSYWKFSLALEWLKQKANTEEQKNASNTKLNWN